MKSADFDVVLVIAYTRAPHKSLHQSTSAPQQHHIIRCSAAPNCVRYIALVILRYIIIIVIINIFIIIIILQSHI